MSLTDLKDLITIVAIVVAGIWTLYRFGITRERYPKLEINLKMNKLGMSRDKHIVEFVAEIANKGLTRQYIRNFSFRLHFFDDTTPFDLSDPVTLHQLKFQKGLTEHTWQKADHHAFVDGGMVRKFTHVTSIDKDVKFVMIYSKFNETRGWLKKQPEKYNIARTFAL